MNMESESKPRSGWIIFPFILGTGFGLALAASGWQLNLVVYMIEEFNVKGIDATLISNVVNGSSGVLPLVGAILADSFLGSFAVVLISALSTLLGMTMFLLTAVLPSLRPPRCDVGSLLCKAATPLQSSILYMGTALGCIGLGWSCLTVAAMGAEQLNLKHQEMFFNWYFIMVNVSNLLGSTVVVYVEDSLSWAVGFGLAWLVAFLSLVIFVTGKRFYVHVKKLQDSPFTSLLRVVVAAIHNARLPNSDNRENYYDGPNDGHLQVSNSDLSKDFSFFNKAALTKIDEPTQNNARTSAWKLCTLEQVEDLKSLIRILPIMSATLLISTSIAVNVSLTILQALTMDRHVGTRFKIPAGSMAVFVFLATTISLALIDRLIYPSWKKLTGHYPTILQRVGAAHVFIFVGFVSSALVESQRHTQLRKGQVMSALWLAPQLILIGVGEAFQYGRVTFCYKEFPETLRSTATAMHSLAIGVALYSSTLVIGVVRRVTKWLPDNIDNGRVDNVYWMFCVVIGTNFVYYIFCARLYKYKTYKTCIEQAT